MKTSAEKSLFLALPVAMVLFLASPAQALFETTTAIKWIEVPPEAQLTIVTYLDGGTVDQIIEETKHNGQVLYEVAIRKPDGQRIELEVRSGGKLTALRYRNKFFKDNVPLSAIPPAVMDTFTHLADGANIEKVAKETREGHTTYETRVTTSDREVIKMKVGEDGKLQELETSRDLFWMPIY